MGLTKVATAGGDALATLSAVVALDVFNRVQPGLGFRAAFVMMGTCFFVSLVLVSVVRSRLRRAQGLVG
jgi:hypothetical protein